MKNYESKIESHVDWFYEIAERLRDYSDGEIWSDGIEILCKTAENFYYDRNFCHKSRKWVEKRAKMSKSGSKNVQKV